MESNTSICYTKCDLSLCAGKDCQKNATHILLENILPNCSSIPTCCDCYKNMYKLCDFTTKLAIDIEMNLEACAWIKWDETTGLRLCHITFGEIVRMRSLLQNIQMLSDRKFKSETYHLLVAAGEILSMNIDLINSLL